MKPIVFQLLDYPDVQIKYMEPFVSPVLASKPEFWYLRRNLRPWENREAWKQGLRSWYWREDTGWVIHTPTQFSSPQSALESFSTSSLSKKPSIEP